MLEPTASSAASWLLNVILASACVVAAGCKGEGSAASGEPAGAPQAISAAPAPSRVPDQKSRFSPEILTSAAKMARQSGQDTLPEMLREGMCPNYVEGARSTLEETEGGVVVTVAAKSEAAAAEIRRRVKYLAEGRSKPPDGTGLCPIHRDAAIEGVDIEGGSRVTVRPSHKLGLEQLRKTTKARFERLPRTDF